MPNCKSFLVTEAERKHVRRARGFNNIETRNFTIFFSYKGKAPKEIHAVMKEILGEHAPSYATVKNWVAQFKRGEFSTCNAPRPG